MADTLWIGYNGDKLYLTSGEFSSTLKTSQSVGAVEPLPRGISSDGTDTLWTGFSDDKLMLTSGQFSSTIKTSQSVGAVEPSPSDISYDGAHTPWSGENDSKLYLTSGEFSSTLKTSRSTSSSPEGISYDGADTPWAEGGLVDRLVLTSGQFSSTIKDSQSVGAIDTFPSGISWNGTDTLWCGDTDNKLYLQSGQFTSTIKTSEAVGGVETNPNGISTTDYNARLGIVEAPAAIPRGPQILRRPYDVPDNRPWSGRNFHTGQAPPPPVAGKLPRPLQVVRPPIHYPTPPQLTHNFHTGLSAPPPPAVPRAPRRPEAPRFEVIDNQPQLIRPPAVGPSSLLPPRVLRRPHVTDHPTPQLVGAPLIDVARRYARGRGRYRVFAAAVYRFYRSNSGPPEESDTPYATSATLPAEPADTFADGTWWLSVSYFNGVLDSGFLPLGRAGERYVRRGLASGAVAGSPPQPPLEWRAQQVGGGVVRLFGVYLELGDNRADAWAITYTNDGLTPSEDDPTSTVAIASTGGLAVLQTDLPAQSHGVTFKVRLQTRRGAVYSEGSTVLTLTIDAQGPSAPPAATAWPGPIPEEA